MMKKYLLLILAFCLSGFAFSQNVRTGFLIESSVDNGGGNHTVTGQALDLSGLFDVSDIVVGDTIYQFQSPNMEKFKVSAVSGTNPSIEIGVDELTGDAPDLGEAYLLSAGAAFSPSQNVSAAFSEQLSLYFSGWGLRQGTNLLQKNLTFDGNGTKAFYLQNATAIELTANEEFNISLGGSGTMYITAPNMELITPTGGTLSLLSGGNTQITTPTGFRAILNGDLEIETGSGAAEGDVLTRQSDGTAKWQYAAGSTVLTADFLPSTTAIFEEVTDLTTPSLPTGIYTFEFYGTYATDTPTDGVGFKIVKGTAGAQVVGRKEVSTSIDDGYLEYFSDGIEPTIHTTSGTTSAQPIIAIGRITVGAAGTILIKFARSNASGTLNSGLFTWKKIR